MKKEILSMLPAALFSWYPFRINARALYITGGDSAFEVLFDVLEEKKLIVTKAAYSQLDTITEKYDYIIVSDLLERVDKPIVFLKKIKEMLLSDGKLLMGVDNRFAIRYFCGDKDKYSNHVLDSIDAYRKVSLTRKRLASGQSYSKAEIEDLLVQSGIAKWQFFSVLPSISRPQQLIRYGYCPNEPLDIRVFPQYKSAQTIYLEEEFLYDSLLKNDMLHQMANGYFVECSMDEELCEADQITVQSDRVCEEALATIVKRDKWVKKKALYKEAIPKLQGLQEKNEYLKAHHIPVVDAVFEHDNYVMPYVEGEIATVYFQNLLRKDKEQFYQEILNWKTMIENSSEQVDYKEVDWEKFEPDWEQRKSDDPNLHRWEQLANGTREDKEDIGIILKRGYVDMVSINCFHTMAGFCFFDQEFYVENFPANAIIIRTIDFIYKDCPEMEFLYPKEELLKKLHLFQHMKVWRKKVNNFLSTLRNEKILLEYHTSHRRDNRVVQANRHRMDYSQEEYNRLFHDIFKGADNKIIYLFGSGNYAEAFMEQFGKYYEIAGILDNNREKWGQTLHDVEIMSPDILKEQQKPYKIYICIKYFESVMEQLKKMGVKDIAVFDSRIEYERPIQVNMKNEEVRKKPYHIGYVAGVFDLFHKGHLNLLKKAKEKCDYLIVGVVSDEQVIQNKKTSPYIPFDERLEIVESCKYVDEAVRIPIEKSSTEAAWYKYHFDVQFSGSDYADDPVWLSKKIFLQQHGSDLVFFPYTESTSSTKIKERIREGK